MAKFIKYTLLIYAISLTILYILSKWDSLVMIYAFFGIIYAPIGGIILMFFTEKYNFSKPVFYLVALGVTLLAFALNLVIMLAF